MVPVLAEDYASLDAMVHVALEAAQGTGLLASGDKVVITGEAPSAPAGQMDFLRVATMP